MISSKSLPGLSLHLFVDGRPVQGSKIHLADVRREKPVGSTVLLSAVVRNRRHQEILSVSHLLTGVGTDREALSQKSLEESAAGDSPEAHREVDLP